ncbi:hypothetical protein T4D_14873 [Trichinella pseudospiralis]|uniref:Uncharacterized protein n=1 Tax=Trichinella pseudospiralis TaxID=6337 RepID=A0A0V1F537_TRIPS|nr:hypothetical protein T4D_14873 [Trichinella pseudospiralis]
MQYALAKFAFCGILSVGKIFSVNVLLVGKFLMALFLISCGVIALVLSSKLIQINILMGPIAIHSVSSSSSSENDSKLIWKNWNL